MKDENKIDWTEWYDMSRKFPPSKLLTEAVSYVKTKGKAIDIGGGALKDTRYLLKKGFDVTVIDKSPLLEKEIKMMGNEKIHYCVTSFEDFRFPTNEYVLASAMQTLSYCEEKHFERVINDIKKSLKIDGVFCGQIYDFYSEESKSERSRSLHKSCYSLDRVKEFLRDMEILFLKEEETEEGRTKQWRIYNFIARKGSN